MKLLENPYLNRAAVRNDRHFFGRQREMATIFNRIDAEQPQSISIVGERRVGKSSLLQAILRQRTAFLRRPEEAIFVFVDLQEKMHADVPQFFSSIQEEIVLRCQDPSIAESQPTYENIRKLVAKLALHRIKLVLLLDEFDAVTQNRNFTLEFFSFLRALPNNYPVSFIVTSERELQELCHSREIAGSPFFNIFHKLNLGCFSPEEAQALIEKPSAEAGLPLEPYAGFILRTAGYFPFFLQLACCAFFDFHEERGLTPEPDLRLIQQIFYDQARNHFDYIWNHLSDREQMVCSKVSAHQALNEADRRFMDGLSRRGYIFKEAAVTRLFSDVFDAFVQSRSPGETPLAPGAGPVGSEISRDSESADQLLEERRRIDDLLRKKYLQRAAILFIDLVGSTSFSEQFGPFEAVNVVKRLEKLIRPVMEQHQAAIIKLVGDAVLGRCDRPENAVAAGIAIQELLYRYNKELSSREQIRVKVAINYGEAVAIEGDVYGDAVNTAERVLRETSADQVCISEFVYDQLIPSCAADFAEKGSFSLKGKAEPVRLFAYRRRQGVSF